MQSFVFSLICFAAAILLWVICGFFDNCISDILRMILSAALSAGFVLFLSGAGRPKTHYDRMGFVFSYICMGFSILATLTQLFHSMVPRSFFLMICPVFFLFFYLSVLTVIIISIFYTRRGAFSKIILPVEFIVWLIWGILLISQGHNIQNSYNLFAVSFSILSASIAFTIKRGMASLHKNDVP